MATTLLGNKNVGDIIKIKENGKDVNFIIVHKGSPSALYRSCDGVWLLRQSAWTTSTSWSTGGQNKDYGKSSANDVLNTTYLNRIDTSVREKIKNVQIPYGTAESNIYTGVKSGADGLSCYVFLLSGYEVGYTNKVTYMPADGAKLDYFSGQKEGAVTYSELALSDGDWWLRSPHTNTGFSAWIICSRGYLTNFNTFAEHCLRPAFILPTDIEVNSDGSVKTNTAPEITANKSGDLGTLTDGFDVEYSVNDEDGDAVTVTETLDDKLIRSYTATPDKQETYSLRGNNWISLANGSHTFKISASDGTETVEHTITFTRNNRAPVITMSRSGNIGTLTDGVDLTYSVTDADNDAVTVTESFDNQQGRQYTAVLGQQERFGLTGNEWLQVTNSSHTFKVSAFDGQQTAEKTVTFTRNQTSLSVTLEEPFTADDNIVACQLKVEGDIPDDAVCVFEVTNNASDWEDCTEETKAGRGHVFKSQGSTFNFRVSIKRGSSGKGGYITEISGGYE